MRLAAIFALALLAPIASAAAQTGDDALLGMWGYRMAFPVGLSGTLTVQHDRRHWHAEISGATADADATPGDIRIVFPNEDGLFRGRLRGNRLEGYWIRRAAVEDPAGTAQGYAMPLTLSSIAPNVWTAGVKPSPNTFTLYLKISRDADGKVVAAFRNPEANSHGPAMQLLVSREGNALQFSTWPDPQTPESRLDAERSTDGVHMFWKDLNRTIVLTRLDAAQSAPFYGRPPGPAPYVYQQPEETGDGWKTARAGALGLNEAALSKTVQAIIDIDPAAKRRSFQIHSLAIAYKGKLVLDEYFHGFTRDQPHDTRSASKTLVSVMLGTAMLHGVKVSPQTKVYPLLASMGPFANPDPRKAEITIADLLTHSSGLDCDDNNDASPGNEDTMQKQTVQPNWWKYTLNLPIVHAPGTHYAYCSANINLVGAAVTTATKTWLPQWFDETIARPLQFGPWSWNLMPNGEGYAGGGAYIRTRDFLKLGQTLLDGGVWNGRRIVSAAWVKDSVSPHIRVSPDTTGLHGDAFAEVYGDGYDAYAWHLTDIKSGARSYHAYLANGNGGQLLVVIPQLDLACMFTAGNYGQGTWLYLRDSIVGNEIIPAVKNRSPKT
jgi:CubicO group peptidase (beta-lactamase class C family)